MKNISLAIVALLLAANASADSATPQSSSDDAPSDANGYCVPIARYSDHMASMRLEYLHRLQINDIGGLRTELETWLALDVQILWASIQDERTSPKDRDQAYGLLQLMAIQNEHFPSAMWNSDPKITGIFQAAIDHDPTHAALLRRQNWNKPKWVEWVD